MLSARTYFAREFGWAFCPGSLLMTWEAASGFETTVGLGHSRRMASPKLDCSLKSSRNSTGLSLSSCYEPVTFSPKSNCPNAVLVDKYPRPSAVAFLSGQRTIDCSRSLLWSLGTFLSACKWPLFPLRELACCLKNLWLMSNSSQLCVWLNGKSLLETQPMTSVCSKLYTCWPGC